jgi:bacterial/archaeal transporter family-2 protein
MSGAGGPAAALAAVAGLAGAVQVAVMSRLGERVGVLPAIAFSATVSFLLGLLLLMATGARFGGMRDALREPVWLWTGGALSLLIVLAITVGGPRIGTTATIGIVIAGNLVMASVIDHFGLFGLDEVPLGWARVLGIVLLSGGAALLLVRV